ncbi:hypothetical protein Moror_12673 [Moniliophthora roreri MCA 2997]|uniref:Uncharacterized protein n=1 Tax=Moniliophthora roreri (strain MCA 2997) TaxID=1381753 RepID=V2XP14_MONRO|nr:hypothetical protein Moror_12673 [Moniliophthora roreri MCA 2997]
MAVYKWQNLNKKEQLGKFFYGLYLFLTQEPVMRPYWACNPLIDANMVSEVAYPKTTDKNTSLDSREVPLLYRPQIENLELLSGSFSGQADPLDHNAIYTQSLIGKWGRLYARGSLVSFTVSSHNAKGAISGSGIDTVGLFTVWGSFNSNYIIFVQLYQVGPQDNHEMVEPYEGTITEDFEVITGQ